MKKDIKLNHISPANELLKTKVHDDHNKYLRRFDVVWSNDVKLNSLILDLLALAQVKLHQLLGAAQEDLKLQANCPLGPDQQYADL